MAQQVPKIFVVVTPASEDGEVNPEDASALGAWEFSLKDNWVGEVRPEQYADAALDCFHSQVAIDVLDDFSFEVYVDGVYAPGLEGHDSYSLDKAGDVDFYTGDDLEIQDICEGRPLGAARVPVLAGDSYDDMDKWFGTMAELGLFFNPDDAPASIEEIKSGKPFFSSLECLKLEGIVGRFFKNHPGTVHECALAHMQRLVGLPTKAPVPAPDPTP